GHSDDKSPEGECEIRQSGLLACLGPLYTRRWRQGQRQFLASFSFKETSEKEILLRVAALGTMSCCNRRNPECTMPHDGQDLNITAPAPILDDLLALTAEASSALDNLVAHATRTLRSRLGDAGRVSGALIETHQVAAHGLAWLATYGQAL